MTPLIAMSAAAGWGIATLLALVAWLATVLVLAAATRPRLPQPAAATMDLGPEPPAIAGFLADRWEVDGDTPAATLCDLAARHHFSIEEVSPSETLIRFPSAAPAGEVLTRYERLVLDHVRSAARGAPTVPCAALAHATPEAAHSWTQQFIAAIVADARERGLSRSRWTKSITTALTVFAAVVAACASAALVALPDKGSSSSDNPAGAFVGITVIGTAVLMLVLRWFRAERDTPQGQIVAARWLGVREYLRNQGAFGDLGPAAVTIWGRYLGYATTLGLAATVSRSVPFGAEDPRSVWSRSGGLWHRLRVDVPGRTDPQWGSTPGRALAVGLLRLLTGLLVVAVIARTAVAIAFALAGDSIHGNGRWWLPFAILGVFALVAIVPARGLYQLVVVGALLTYHAAADFRRPLRVHGDVVRVGSWRVAKDRSQRYFVVDPGGDARRVRAWALPSDHAGIGVGTTVDVTVYGHLRTVKALQIVTPRAT